MLLRRDFSQRDEGPVWLVLCALGNPAAKHIFLTGGEIEFALWRRHAGVIIGRCYPEVQLTFFRVARNDSARPGFLIANRIRALGGIKAQLGFARLFIGPMTFETP